MGVMRHINLYRVIKGIQKITVTFNKYVICTDFQF